ncbi:hypothetical protein B0J12DRAFT_728080 [Macrophomina phaseolina]|uniref:Uncharacterized protein n=1 Tax=Macrophomina phaseolina TaxID=35725 RepID=A0ABQ8GBG9_9PEZI|nr:hypothetical protein B0J12DRAFT_728080 [Macrophomina phaseolina]
MITGNNKDKCGASTSASYTVAEYITYNKQWYGNFSSQHFKLYPASNASQADVMWNEAAKDLSLVSSYRFANGWTKSERSPLYSYYWDYAPNNLCGNDLPWTAYDFYLADVIAWYEANFMKTGNSNLGGLVQEWHTRGVGCQCGGEGGDDAYRGWARRDAYCVGGEAGVAVELVRYACAVLGDSDCVDFDRLSCLFCCIEAPDVRNDMNPIAAHGEVFECFAQSKADVLNCHLFY